MTVSIPAVSEDLQWFGDAVASMVFAVGRASWRGSNESIGLPGVRPRGIHVTGPGMAAGGIVAELLGR